MNPYTRKIRLGRLASAAALIMASFDLVAAQFAYSDLYVTGWSGETVFSDTVNTTRTGTDTAAVGLSPSISYVNPVSYARASYGTLKAYAHADSNVPNDGTVEFYRRTNSASASARWTTTASVSAPGVPTGVTGTGTATLEFNTALSYDAQGTTGYNMGTGYANQTLTVGGVQDSAMYDGRYQLRNGVGFFDVYRTESGQAQTRVRNDTNPGDAGGFSGRSLLEVNFSFVTGQPITIDAQLSVFGRSISSGGGTGVDWITNAGNSAYWLGLSDVFIDGVAIADYSFIDASTGIDLSGATAVPLPATAPLFALALAGLVGVRRRKHRAH